MYVPRVLIFMYIGVSLVMCKPYLEDIGVMACLGTACMNEVHDMTPLCAISASGQARTFSNMCQLELTACKDNMIYAVVREGEC